jgi:hypothetical protein
VVDGVEAVGERFARAFAAKDGPGLTDVLCPDVDFKAMTPGQFWESTDAAQIVDDVVLGQWFAPEDRIVELREVEHGQVGSRARVRYLLAVENPDGSYLVEQLAYYETDGEQITWLRIMCSGYLPVD